MWSSWRSGIGLCLTSIVFDATEIPVIGVGLEYRGGLHRSGPIPIPDLFDYVEIQPTDLIVDPGLLDALCGIRAILHVSHLSLGSIGIPMDREFLRLTCRLLRRTGSPWMSEHISWNRFHGGDTRHFVLPFLGDEVLETIVSNAIELRRLTGLPVLLENAPRTFVVDLPGDAPEAVFINDVLERADAGFLLDLESARATAETLGQDLWTYLRTMPLHRTVEVHVADPEADWNLLLSVLTIAPVRAITLGWELMDRSQDEGLVEAVRHLRALIGMGRRCPPCPAVPPALDANTPVHLAPGVAATLRGGRLRVTGGAQRVRLELPVETLPLLAHFAVPQPLFSAFMLPGLDKPAAMVAAAAAVQALLETGALGSPGPDGLDDGGTWDKWDSALDFYLDTRTGVDTKYATLTEMEEALASKANRQPQPSAYKDYWAHPFLPLPNPLVRDPPTAASAGFFDVLLRRRSVRAFAPGPLDVRDLSALLFYVWGATSVQPNHLGDVFLHKTSPSAGSLHGAEVYPLLMDVEGFEPGVYHYSVRRHGLVLLSREDPRPWIGEACGGQDWVAGAGALFLITFNVGRLAWKYGFSRAFRAAMLDVGHLGQTFALVATYLGLAPFTTAALRDEMFEDRLGLDYLAEPVLMINGVGKPDPTCARPDRPRSGA
jgi:SagB-type dehydrogenase family enzyme